MNSIDRAFADYVVHGTRALESFCEEVAPNKGLFDDLIDAALVPATSVPATWLLRALLAAHECDGIELESRQVSRLCRGLAKIERNDARLHICQTVTHVTVPPKSAEPMARFLRACLSGDHKFTRAWAVDALQRLARRHPRYRSEAATALDDALHDPAASVRARARRIAAEQR